MFGCFGDLQTLDNSILRQEKMDLPKEEFKKLFEKNKENEKQIDNLIDKIEKDKNFRINAIIKFLLKTAKEEDVKIILTKAQRNSDISKISKTNFGKLNGLYVADGERIRIYLSNDLNKENQPRDSKTIRILLHEVAHHVVNKLGISQDKRMMMAANKTIMNAYMYLWTPIPFNSHTRKTNAYIIKSIIGKSLFEKKNLRAEEILCDTFKMLQYQKRHPERAAQVEKIFKPMLKYIDKEIIPKIV